MNIYLVVEKPKDWPLAIPGVQVIAAREYLTGPPVAGRGVRVFNLCKSYRYQSLGYYVSLLADARGHKPLPRTSTILDMKSLSHVRFVSEDLDDLIEKSLARLASDRFTLSIYFGRNVAKQHDRLASKLFAMFRAPLLRATFSRNGGWHLTSVGPIPAADIPPEHHPFVIEAANAFFESRSQSKSTRPARFDLAILYSEDDPSPPSDERAIARFVRAAKRLSIEAEIIDKTDYDRVAEFDGLFVRETTSVPHHTFRFARRAVSEGLAVIDDPESILRCSNKVFLAELLSHHRIHTPRTVVVHPNNIDEVERTIGYPCVVKQPDSAFSMGVFKVENRAALIERVDALLDRSEFAIAQEFLPTPFDWRVGVLDRQPLFVCKYHMASRHWQIIRHSREKAYYGKVETIPVEAAPPRVVSAAVRAANLVGDGLYGVDVKLVGGRPYVIEVNDNPNIESDIEDKVLGDELYDRVMRAFLARMSRKRGIGP
ncbi:RimK family protein [bacterium]|nr:RimK family protein [bacterium]